MRAVMRRSFAQLRRSWYVFFFQLPWLPEKMLGAHHARGVGEAIRAWRSINHASRRCTGSLSRQRKRARRADRHDQLLPRQFRHARPRHTTPRIETPTLMIWGEQDTALGLELTEGYDRYVRDFTLKRLPGVSHWVQQEAPNG